MTDISKAGTFKLGERTVKRMGYGAMQLAGPHVFGPPKDRAAAIAVLRKAVASGRRSHRHQRFLRTACHQPDHPRSAPSLSRGPCDRDQDRRQARRRRLVESGHDAGRDFTSAVHDNLRNLGLDALEVVNLRFMFDVARSRRGPDRGAAHSSGRSPAEGARASHRPQQCDVQAGRRRSRDRARSSACRTTTTSRIATTMR